MIFPGPGRHEVWRSGFAFVSDFAFVSGVVLFSAVCPHLEVLKIAIIKG